MSVRLVNPGDHLPTRKAKAGKAKDKQRISTCNICREGVYDTEPHEWARGRYLGVCHTECVERQRRVDELNRERHGDGSRP